ncbi:MAG: hypothetical protein GXN96_01720 [Aquificae bacterium]|nr:hypothetical protein [Aquificota bacterium]
MESVFIIGLLLGLLYSEYIFIQVRRGRNPVLTAPLRLTLLGVVLFFVVRERGAEGGLAFVLGFVSGRTALLLMRVFRSRKL